MRTFTSGKSPRELLVDKLCAMIVRKIDCMHDRCFFEPIERDGHILTMALERGWLTDERLRKTVHESICKDGRVSYEQHMRNPRWTPPDHVFSAAALGYAIKHGAITCDECLLIEFDHGDTLDDAMAWSGNIFEHALAVVRNYKKSEEKRRYPFCLAFTLDGNGDMIGEPYTTLISQEPKGMAGGSWCEGCICC